MDNGVARRAALVRDPRGIVETIHLNDHAIDFVGQLAAQVPVFIVSRHDVAPVETEQLVHPATRPPTALDRNSPSLVLPQQVRMTFKTNAFAHTHRIEDSTDGSLSHDLWVEQLQRSGGRIPGIGRDLFARRRQPRIHGTKVFQRHVRLAPDLNPLGWVRGLQLKRYGAKSAQVGCDVVAEPPIAPGHS